MGDLKLNGATSGTITLTPTAVAGTNTITLPASTGTVALTASPTFTGTVTFPGTGVWNSSGNVGIGTSSPVTNLQISSSTGPSSDDYGFVQANYTGSTTTVNAGITVKNYQGTSQFMQWDVNGLRLGSRIKTNTGTGQVVFTYGNDSEAMRIDSSGNFLVGATSQVSSERFQVYSNNTQNIIHARAGASASSCTLLLASNATGASSFDFIGCYNGAGTGQFRVSNTGVIYAQNTTVQSISDIKIKTNVKDLDYGLTQILALTPRRYDFIEGWGGNRKNVMGFVAQEVESVIPELVDEAKFGGLNSEETHKTLGLTDLIPVLVAAIQELSAKNDALEARLAALEAK